jgi:hypothetical protein
MMLVSNDVGKLTVASLRNFCMKEMDAYMQSEEDGSRREGEGQEDGLMDK